MLQQEIETVQGRITREDKGGDEDRDGDVNMELASESEYEPEYEAYANAKDNPTSIPTPTLNPSTNPSPRHLQLQQHLATLHASRTAHYRLLTQRMDALAHAREKRNEACVYLSKVKMEFLGRDGRRLRYLAGRLVERVDVEGFFEGQGGN